MSASEKLVSVKQSLTHSPCTIDQLWQDHAAVWQQLGWCPSQIKLWAGCLHDIHIETSASGEKTYRLPGNRNPVRPDIADQIVALLEKAGKPLPLTLLIKKMPPGLVVTEPMIRAAADRDHRLELRGPLVKLA
jgi:hypothetical protein